MHEVLTRNLQNRKQYTEYRRAKSSLSSVLRGVLQGSTLGPLLFSLCINDLSLHTTEYNKYGTKIA